MSKIPIYKLTEVQNFMSRAKKQYEKIMSQPLDFEEWKCLAYPTLLREPERFEVTPIKFGEPIRIAPSGMELLKILEQHTEEINAIKTTVSADQQDAEITKLLKQLFKPKMEFTLAEPLTIPGTFIDRGKQVTLDVPVWFNSTVKCVNVRLGFANLDASTPASVPLGDKPVHMMLGGMTGSGKSVALNDIICSLLLEYPPWELSLVLADFKIVELARYANRIPTPHVKLVAATGSTEFALSTFKYLTDEMNARQKVFTAAGTQNLKDFRKKFNLCMPRILLIADEFVQMFENVKIAVENGSENADEVEKSIKNAISAVARLGRSQGVHMLLSSQNLDNTLDEQTTGQFAAGASLKATPSVSKALIGVEDGKNIRFKGRALTTLDKTGTGALTQVRVPYIESEPKVVDGVEQKTYLLSLLETLNGLATSLDYKSEPFYYNEQDTIPKKFYYDSLAECKRYMENPDEGDSIRNELYKSQTFARLPLGRELAYTEELAYAISLQFKKEHNLLINADDNITKVNIVRLIGEGLAAYSKKFVIAYSDVALYKQANLEEFAGDAVSVEVDSTGGVPLKYLNMAQSRRELLNVQGLFDTKSEGHWDDEQALVFEYNLLKSSRSLPLAEVQEILQGKYADLVNGDIERIFSEANTKLEGSDLDFVESLLAKWRSLRSTYAALSNNFTQRLSSRSFASIVVWWLGVDGFENIQVSDVWKSVQAYLSSSCQVGIFNVLVPSLRCDKISPLCAACNFILEKCGKQFFVDAEITPKIPNINENSYQVFDRSVRTHTIVRVYS